MYFLWVYDKERKKMSASTVVHNFCSVASCISNCRQKRTLVPTHHAFHSPNSLLRLKKQSFLLNTHFKSSRTQKPPSSFVVSAAQSNFVKGQPQFLFFCSIILDVFRKDEGMVISSLVKGFCCQQKVLWRWMTLDISEETNY